jgi:methylisocitrate lyase
MREALKVILEQGTQKPILDKMMTRKELYELINYYEYEEFDRKIAEEVDKMLIGRFRLGHGQNN